MFYYHLQVFESKTLVHVPKEQKRKLDDITILYIFLDYGSVKFGYRLWDLENGKIIRHRNVILYEDKKLTDFEKVVKL